MPGGFEWSSIAVGPLGWELPFQVCHSPQQVSCPHFLTGFEFLIDSECVLCNWVSHFCTLLACQPAWALVCASCGWHQQFPYIGIPFSIRAQLLAKSPCLQKTPSRRLCKWINIDLVKSHFERLNLWANAFKPSTLHGGWLYWADGIWLLCSAPRMVRRKSSRRSAVSRNYKKCISCPQESTLWCQCRAAQIFDLLVCCLTDDCHAHKKNENPWSPRPRWSWHSKRAGWITYGWEREFVSEISRWTWYESNMLCPVSWRMRHHRHQ